MTTTLVWPGGASATMFCGQVIDGGCVSLTVTVNEQFAVPATFEAVHVTVLVPTENGCGEVIAVAPIMHVTVGAGSPVTAGANASVRAHVPGKLFVVMLAGHWMVGGVLTTVQAFIAVQLNETPLTVPVA